MILREYLIIFPKLFTSSILSCYTGTIKCHNIFITIKMGFGLLPVLFFKIGISFYFNKKLPHHPLTKQNMEIKLTTTYYCVFKTKGHLQLKKY